MKDLIKSYQKQVDDKLKNKSFTKANLNTSFIIYSKILIILNKLSLLLNAVS